MTVLTQLTPFTYHVLILMVVLIIKSVISHYIAHEPLRFFQFYCLQLGNKVNNSKNSIQHQTIAGLLSLLVTLVPISIILWLFADFVAVDYLWQGLLLYLALGCLNLGQINTVIARALVAKQNYQAKKTLKPWLLRETEQLSQVGLSKAAIEMQLLRSTQQIYVVSFLFITLGPLAALSYRLILEMHYCWNSKLVQFKHFGFYSQLFIQLLQWLPSRLMALLILLSSVGQGSSLSWRLTRGHFFKLNNDFIIAVFAFSLSVRLGGVAMYQNEKLRKVAFNDLGKQPEPRDIIKASSKVGFAIYSSLVLLVFFAIGWQLVAFS
ncbi:cobalamin biosynthesis protein [Colwellia psychrerythraea]|uniref:Cobalamin biosynthesis protein CbiB n=1 Tax=Colwellia psychrerythraea TaxID=28229 RepID=A0A099L112_COLPS|nr:cobalamin biosynthesis protein [Colwellia psychrerythraea]KGJ96649.1 cobalamin biosynthesis protein CbiB [Colwellia psychrerythraea]